MDKDYLNQDIPITGKKKEAPKVNPLKKDTSKKDTAKVK